jgi:hypothetical protein
MLTLHLHAVKCKDPAALVPVADPSNSAAAIVRDGELKGVWYRVFPETPTDVYRLSLLDHHVDKYSPVEGGGVFISARAMYALQR